MQSAHDSGHDHAPNRRPYPYSQRTAVIVDLSAADEGERAFVLACLMLSALIAGFAVWVVALHHVPAHFGVVMGVMVLACLSLAAQSVVALRELRREIARARVDALVAALEQADANLCGAQDTEDARRELHRLGYSMAPMVGVVALRG